MNFLEQIESANKISDTSNLWRGTFREFLAKYETDRNKNPNIGVLSHQRIYNMIMAAGTRKEEHYGIERIRYNFFEDSLFGIEETVDEIMNYFHSAAQKTETSRRMLLIYGPVSSGKSAMCERLKRGLEAYSKSHAGAIYALSGSKMHENPFLLVPESLRPDFEKQYGLSIEGALSPSSAHRLREEFHGKFMDYPVEQIYMDEAARVGIGTWIPTDEKCITENCVVLTNDGLVKGKDLFAQFENGCHPSKAVGMDGFVDLVNCHDNGIQNVYKVCLRGMSIEATSSHRFLSLDTNGLLVHNKVCEIVGKCLPIKIGSNIFGNKTKLSRPNKSFCTLPEELNPDLARFIGYLIPSKVSSKPDFTHKDMISILKEQFDVDACVFCSSPNNILDCCKCYKSEINEFINANFDCLDRTFENAEIPSFILSSSKACQIEFLEGLFIKHTSCHLSSIFTSHSSVLVHQLQAMLINLGVYVHICVPRYNKTFYTLEISSTDALTLANILPKFMQFYKFEFENLKQTEYESFGDLKGLIGDINSSVADMNCYEFPTRTSLLEWLSYLESDECQWKDISQKESIVTRLKTLLSYKFIPVIKTELIGRKPVFDLEVNHEDHVFVINGLISHNSQDQSELIGGIDFSRIQEFGDEADPRTYNFNGELNVANRGMMEFIEGLRANERFLRILLIATQEKSIKAPRFGLIYCDSVIILHCNEPEFHNFTGNKAFEAYHDRMYMVPAPYNLSVTNEIKIYEQLLAKSDAIKGMHIAPKTLDAVSMFAVLTRLVSPPDGADLTLIKKMKLYDKQHVKGYKIEQVPKMKRSNRGEGMFGISPRFIIDQISVAISNARDEERDYITALDVLRQLKKGIQKRDSFTKEEKAKYEALVDETRSEWDDMLKNDIQKAFFVSYEAESRNLCENYLDHIHAACAGEKPRDLVTGEEIELDEKLMDSIEKQIDISESGKEDFRNEIIRAVSNATRKDKKFDYTQHADLKVAIQKKLFEERKNVIRMTVSTRNPDVEELKKINDVIARMHDQQGYSEAAANALLKYATAHLFDK